MLTASITIHGGAILCSVSPDTSLNIGQPCIVEADGIQEWGVVRELAEMSEEGLHSRDRHAGHVLRAATPEDAEQLKDASAFEEEAMRVFRKHVGSLRMPMRPLSARSSFGRERLLLLFSAETSVDFRRLVYHLRRDLGTRVELRQVGVRDEAGLLGGMGPCGRKLCCCTWLHHFRVVNVRMARTQEISLNPNAISGMCGRLKCCLRYEYDQYREAGRDLPRDGTHVQWERGQGVVIGRDVLSGRLAIRTSERGIVHVNVDELTGCRALCENLPKLDEPEDMDELPPTGVE